MYCALRFPSISGIWRKLHLFQVVFVLSTVLMGCAQNPEVPPTTEQTKVSGAVDADTVWSSKHNPYIVVGDITVKRGTSLKIEPGVEVRFDGFYWLIMQGTLVASGTSEAPILFSSNKPNPDIKAWGGIRFQNTNDDKSHLQMVKVEYADVGIDCFSSSPQITDCWVMNNRIGIRALDSSPIITQNLIQGNLTGVFVEQTVLTPSFLKNIVTQNQEGIVILFPFRVMKQNNLFDNSDHAVVVKSSWNIDARENWWGSTDLNKIEEQIVDKHDSSELGQVIYLPIIENRVNEAGPRI